jgi:hypothetical protein
VFTLQPRRSFVLPQHPCRLVHQLAVRLLSYSSVFFTTDSAT